MSWSARTQALDLHTDHAMSNNTGEKFDQIVDAYLAQSGKVTKWRIAVVAVMWVAAIGFAIWLAAS